MSRVPEEDAWTSLKKKVRPLLQPNFRNRGQKGATPSIPLVVVSWWPPAWWCDTDWVWGMSMSYESFV